MGRLKRHLQKDANLSVALACDSCDKVYLHKNSLIRHKRTEHPNYEKSSCKTCGREFITKHQLKRHQKIHEDQTRTSRLHVCEVCGSAYVTKVDLTTHQLKHDGLTGDFLCDKCNKSYTTIRSLRRHKKDVHFEKTCRTCGQQFSSDECLKRHQVVHKSQNSTDTPVIHKCQICGNTYPNKGNLYKHQLTHIDKAIKFSCDSCDNVYTCRNSFRRHKKIEHSNYEKPTCKTCGKQFKRIDHLKNHLRNHEDSSLNAANKTDQSSHEDNARVNPHQLKQTDFLCHICGKALNSPKSLMLHYRFKHNNDGDEDKQEFYRCLKCNRTFKKRSNLKIHAKIHDEKHRKYKCKNCGRGFFIELGLRIHDGMKICLKQTILLQSKVTSLQKKYKRITQNSGNVSLASRGDFKPIPTYRCCKRIFKCRKVYLMHTFRYHREKYQLLKSSM